MGKKKEENYLKKCPVKPVGLDWTEDENKLVTFNIENKGIMNKIAQKLFKKPKISYIHLDELGSFVWSLIDGVKTISEYGEPVKEKFGESAEPLYERLARYFQILETYGFIKWN